MTKTPSIFRRLVLSLIGVVVLFWLIASGLATLVMQYELDEVFDSALQETAQRLLPLAVNDLFRREKEDDKPYEVTFANIAEHNEFLIYQVRNKRGEVLLRSHDAPLHPFSAPLKTGLSSTSLFRIYTEASISNTLFIQVAEPLEHRREALAQSTLALVLPLIILIPISIFGIWWVVQSGLRPITTLQSKISSLEAGNLTPIEIVGLPIEIQPIVQAVNQLIFRLNNALEAERTFTSNSAHELRTPIAGALAQTQRLIIELENHPVQARAQSVETSLNRLRNLAEKLLQMSRADAGVGIGSSLNNLVPVLELVVDEFERQPIYAGRISLSIDESSELLKNIDVDAFGIVVRNLIENALKHSVDDGVVEVFVDEFGAIHFINSGPMVPPEILERIKARFERGQSSSDGSGLGLAIVETILHQIGGRLELYSPALGRDDGFEAIVFI